MSNLKCLTIVILKLYSLNIFIESFLFGFSNIAIYMASYYVPKENLSLLPLFVSGILPLVVSILLWKFSVKIASFILNEFTQEDLNFDSSNLYFEKIVFSLAGLLLLVSYLPQLIFSISGIILESQSNLIAKAVGQLLVVIIGILLLLKKEGIQELFAKLGAFSRKT